MDARLIEPSDPVWADSLAVLRHDFYHLPSYAAFAARRQDAGEARAFVAVDGSDRMLLPLTIRPVPDELDHGDHFHDAVSPRGFPGPLFGSEHGSMAPGFADRAVSALHETLRGAGIVSAFVRLHPLLSTPIDVLRRAGDVFDQGDAVSIDVTRTPEEMWGLTRASYRRSINKARRAGYVVRIDHDWTHLADFAEAYRQSMVRLGAAPYWHLPLDYFAEMREVLGEWIRLCVVEREGEFACAAMLTECDGIAEYHASATMDAHVRASPTKLIVDFARLWARDRGDRVLNLAGSTRKGDTLIHFKLGFSPLKDPMYSWRTIADRVAYDRLVERAGPLAGSAGDVADIPFFPAYRRPRLVAS